MNERVRPTILVSRAEAIPGERWEEYIERIADAGGDPRTVAVLEPGALDALPPFDGLVLTSGVDVDPSRYGAERDERVATIDPGRDEAETTLLEQALAQGIPVLCICRGFQLLNVVQGGSLLQHLVDREPHRARRGADGETVESGWHTVAVEPGTLLASITGGGELRVNSRHHQAVETHRVAPGVRVAAVSPDGIVEAIEVPGHPWALGVQWHPERAEMVDDPAAAAGAAPLFEAFVAAARKRAGRAGG